MEPNVACSICCWSCIGNVGGSRLVASSEPIRPTCWQPFARCAGWNASERPCVTRSTCFPRSRQSGGFRTWTRHGPSDMRNASVIFAYPKTRRRATELAETIGADGRRLFEQVCAESRLPWLRELDAIETLRRVWMQHYHASEQGTPWRAEESCLPQRS